MPTPKSWVQNYMKMQNKNWTGGRIPRAPLDPLDPPMPWMFLPYMYMYISIWHRLVRLRWAGHILGVYLNVTLHVIGRTATATVDIRVVP